MLKKIIYLKLRNLKIFNFLTILQLKLHGKLSNFFRNNECDKISFLINHNIYFFIPAN